jgi:uncharacterized protein
MNFGLNENTIDQIKNVFLEFPEVEKAEIFGSRAKGNYRNGSDIDIAIFGNSVSENIALDISGILNERKPLPYYFDIISYPTLKNADLKDHIDRVGLSFYTKQIT